MSAHSEHTRQTKLSTHNAIIAKTVRKHMTKTFPISLSLFLVIILSSCSSIKLKNESQKPLVLNSIYKTYSSASIGTKKFEWKIYSSPEGNYLLTGSDKFTGISFRNNKGDILWENKLQETLELESASISKNGKYVAVGVQKGFAFLFSKSGTLLWKKRIKGEVQIQITDKGDRIYTIGSSGKVLHCFDNNGDLLFSKNINHRNWGAWTLSITPDADRVLIGTNSDIIIMNRNGQVLHHYDIVLGNKLARGTISPDGKYFAHHTTSNKKNHHRVVCRDIDNNLLWQKPIGYAHFKFDTLNNLYVSSRYGDIKIYNIKGKLIGWVEAPETIGISISRDGSKLFSTTKGNLNIYNRK